MRRLVLMTAGTALVMFGFSGLAEAATSATHVKPGSEWTLQVSRVEP
jgi:hypothetical protein